jgi:hypothetical protein
MDDFQYRPLDALREIRLLGFRTPQDFDSSTYQDQPLFDIIHVTLEEAPKYETVSYTWGSSAQEYDLVVRDGNQAGLPQKLKVTKSLFEALPRLTAQSDTGYLWIDQLCINQQDVEERNAQVSKMGMIYRQCTRVLIWLGEETTNTTHLRDLLDLTTKSVPDDVRTLADVDLQHSLHTTKEAMIEWIATRTKNHSGVLGFTHETCGYGLPQMTESTDKSAGDCSDEICSCLAERIRDTFEDILNRTWVSELLLYRSVVESGRLTSS